MPYNVTELNKMAQGILSLEPRDRSKLIAEHRPVFLDALNSGTNTLDSNLQRVAILQEAVRAFAHRVAPVAVFSTKFDSVPLSGTNEVVVPYYALQSAASTDFSSSYVMGDTATSMKKVTVNKRKYQAMSFTSAERSRQPALDTLQLAVLNAEKLAYDVFRDILSLVTAANFGAAFYAGAASGWDLSQVADLRNAVKLWSAQGRSLVLDSSFDAALLKDGWIIANPNGTGASAVEGRVPSKLMGFDYYETPSIPDNSENLAGFAVHKAAAVVAFSPIRPAESVPVTYDTITDPGTGLTLEYRRWGNPDYDCTREVIEANYGYVLGDATALKRITTA